MTNVTLPQVFFKLFAGKNQSPGLSVGRTLVENRLMNYIVSRKYQFSVNTFTVAFNVRICV